MPEPIAPTSLDHLIALALLFAVPLLGRMNYRRFQEAVARGGSDARRQQYWKEIRRQWIIAAGLVAGWLALGRPLVGLGLGLPLDGRTLWGVGITVVAIAFLFRQWRTVTEMSPEELSGQTGQIEGVRDLLPQTDPEVQVFRGLAVTAGVCEEIIFRGWLIAYLAAFMPVWPAAVVGGTAFGAAHAYQGVPGMIKTGATDVLTGLLYVGTGLTLLSIVNHAAIDLHGGAVGRRAFIVSKGIDSAAPRTDPRRDWRP